MGDARLLLLLTEAPAGSADGRRTGLAPRPDFWATRLWHDTMGRRVLEPPALSVSVSPAAPSPPSSASSQGGAERADDGIDDVPDGAEEAEAERGARGGGDGARRPLSWPEQPRPRHRAGSWRPGGSGGGSDSRESPPRDDALDYAAVFAHCHPSRDRGRAASVEAAATAAAAAAAAGGGGHDDASAPVFWFDAETDDADVTLLVVNAGRLPLSLSLPPELFGATAEAAAAAAARAEPSESLGPAAAAVSRVEYHVTADVPSRTSSSFAADARAQAAAHDVLLNGQPLRGVAADAPLASRARRLRWSDPAAAAGELHERESGAHRYRTFASAITNSYE